MLISRFSQTRKIINQQDYYQSEDSDLSYFNAKNILDTTDSDTNQFKDAVSEYEYASEDVTRYASSEAGGNRTGLESIEAFNYQSKDGRKRPRRNDSNEIDFLTDHLQRMTYGRRIALCLSRKYAWYNPQLKPKEEEAMHKTEGNQDDGAGANRPEVEENGLKTMAPMASIEKAWAYFEHITLPRHKYIPKNEPEPVPVAEDTGIPKPSSFDSVSKLSRKVLKGEQKLDIAVPGENTYETEFYHPITTPLNQMGDFGLGVGLYFATLRAMTVLMILAGLMNIPNIRYFMSNKYSKAQQGVKWYLKGSAVCNVQEWVPCPTCTSDDFKDIEERFLQNVIIGVEEQELILGLRNNCDGATFRVGMVNFGTTLLVLVGVIALRFYLQKKEIEFDLDEQTAQDYSIAVRNPPDDAVHPEEWRDFFMTNFHGSHVTCCTVAVDNDDLVHTLVARRELLKTIEDSLPDESDFSIENLKKTAIDIESKRNSFQRFLAKISGGIPAKVYKLVHLNDTIVELSQKPWPASTIFVTFENELAQRLVLEKMLVAQVDATKQNRNAVSDQNLLFRGEHVCLVEEPAEPSTIRWQDLGVTKKEVAIKFLATGFVLVLLAVSFYVIQTLHRINVLFSAFAISFSNAIFPTLAKMLSKVEKHANEERREVWLYIKIAIFRCLNTVVVILIITPYTSTTLGEKDDLLAGVYSIFFAEIVTANVLQLLDIAENFKRHFLAPRAKSQEAMNLNMRGSEIFLAERYTNMTKLVFLAIWYCPLYPGVLFMSAIALFINFFTDRFSLMRSWKPSPKLGRSMSVFTRDFVFPIFVITMAFVAVRNWSFFTYDHLCKVSSSEDEMPDIEIEINGTAVNLKNEYRFCARNSEGMTNEQENLISIYATSAYTVTAAVAAVVIACILFYVRRIYVASYKPTGEAQDIPFSTVDSRTAYIPQVKSEAFAFPFLACPVEKIRDCDLFEWEDPQKPYDDYDITEDSRQLLIDNRVQIDRSLAVFSQMLYCPPPVLQ